MRLSIPNLRILRAFEAVGRLESISGAARAIYLSQPAVTQAIAKLEGILGEQLFYRRTTGTYLTADGVALHRDTARLLGAMESALSRLLPGLSDLEVLALINRITSSQLECLIAIAECSNSKAAAKRYDTHESSIIRSARELEKAVGVQLLRRTAAGVQVTEPGAAFAMHIAVAFHEFDSSLQAMFASRKTDVVMIGAPVLDNAGLLAAVVNEFADLTPSATVRLFNEPFESLRLRLRTGTLDLIVGVLKPHSSDLTSEVLLEERYRVAGRVGHPLAAKQKVSVADLSRYNWIVPNRTAPRREAFEKIFANASKRPAANIETHSLATITMTLASSDRLALLTESELKTEGPIERLVPIPYPLNGACARIGLTYLSTAAHSPHHETLVSLFRKHAQSVREMSSLTPP
jgi:LysR family transcriptional regulator, regulator for genes of the gallate degradation pathway